jgi:hypothetical protein
MKLHPIRDPLGDCAHHTDVPMTAEDRSAGDLLARNLGTLFADHQQPCSCWFYTGMTTEEWSRVVRALRIHGLRIVDQE